jgi:hypothetical protein
MAVDVTLAGRSLRCPSVSQTPIYNQLRGEFLCSKEVSTGWD